MHISQGGSWLNKMIGSCFIGLFILVVLLPEFLRMMVYAVQELAPYIAGGVGLLILVLIVLKWIRGGL